MLNSIQDMLEYISIEFLLNGFKVHSLIALQFLSSFWVYLLISLKLFDGDFVVNIIVGENRIHVRSKMSVHHKFNEQEATA